MLCFKLAIWLFLGQGLPFFGEKMLVSLRSRTENNCLFWLVLYLY